MKINWRNLFFLIGVLAIVIMLVGMRSHWTDAREALGLAGLWFPVLLLLWGVIYLMNACSFGLILKGGGQHIPFSKVWQLTVSGYALNYVTPLGLLGGEPYRIMELSGYIGTKRATAATVLYAMMHVSSHFGLWLSAIPLYVALHFLADAAKYPLGTGMIALLFVMAVVFTAVLYLFSLGYRKGFVVKVLGLLDRIPYVRRWTRGFTEKNMDKLQQVDLFIADLHGSRRASFWGSLLLEYLARIISSVEYWILIGLLAPGFTFFDGLLVLAFSSLFSNMIFFSPMQLGGREGGVALAAGSLCLPSAYGLYGALVARLRELVWTVIGILIMKLPCRKKDC